MGLSNSKQIYQKSLEEMVESCIRKGYSFTDLENELGVTIEKLFSMRFKPVS